MTSNQLPLPLGKKRKLAGINKAVRNADRVNQGWQDRCYKLFKEWLSRRRTPFTVESFREHVKTRLPLPPSLRVFGAIVRRAKNEGIVKHVDYTQCENPKSHAANISLWMRV